ncbi:MAG: SRPBCC domain-containing protein [Dehalococcoidia bacterium]|nr:SRPBCC domain-containing protein [Dehalococcoidia bacterium]
MTGATSITQVGERELVVTRTFNAPRALVWKAWTEPERIKQWWGPDGFTTIVPTIDVRPGGVWHYCMQSSEWGDAWGKATYREVVEPERLVYIDAFSDEAGNTAEGMPVSEVTLTFEEQDGRTLMTSRTLFASAEERQKVIEMGMEQGLSQTLDHLEEFLAQNNS